MDTCKKNEKRQAISDLSFTYYGALPDKGIFILSNGKMDRNIEKTLYITSLEAALNGYDVVYISGNKGAKYIESGALDGGGRLFSIVAFGFENLYASIKRRILLSGGGIIIPDIIAQSNAIAIELSLALLVANEDYYILSQSPSILYALDSNKDVALLKSSLCNTGASELIADGCAVVDTFSDFLISPRAIGYESANGKYGKDGFGFDIIYTDGR